MLIYGLKSNKYYFLLHFRSSFLKFKYLTFIKVDFTEYNNIIILLKKFNIKFFNLRDNNINFLLKDNFFNNMLRNQDFMLCFNNFNIIKDINSNLIINVLSYSGYFINTNYVKKIYIYYNYFFNNYNIYIFLIMRYINIYIMYIFLYFIKLVILFLKLGLKKILN